MIHRNLAASAFAASLASGVAGSLPRRWPVRILLYVSALAMADIHSKESGKELTHQLLRLTPRPDGIFAYNDSMAIGAIHAVLDSGLRIPEDIAIIGAGNLHYGADLRVPLSSIDQQTEQLGKNAARLTLSLLGAKTPSRPKSIVIKPQLVVRASTDRKANR